LRRFAGVPLSAARWRACGRNPERSRGIENLRYIHRNPVTRGLVARPEDWEWSSFRHYLTGAAGAVEIESPWTARRRERLGIFPMLKVRAPAENPRPKPALSEVERAKLERGPLERKIARGWPAHPPGSNLRNSDRNVLTTQASDELRQLPVCTIDCRPVVGIWEVHVPHQIP